MRLRLRWLKLKNFHFLIKVEKIWWNLENLEIFKILKIWKFRKPEFSNFRIFENFKISHFSFPKSCENFQLWSKMKNFNFNHRKRSRTVGYTYPKMIRCNFQAEQSILKIGHFWDFSKFSVPDPDLAQPGHPQVICSSMALWSSRRPARPRGAASAAPDDQTHAPSVPWY